MDNKVIYVDFTKYKRAKRQKKFKLTFLNILKNVFHIPVPIPSKKSSIHPLRRNNIKVKP
jgi:hypothetical protein